MRFAGCSLQSVLIGYQGPAQIPFRVRKKRRGGPFSVAVRIVLRRAYVLFRGHRAIGGHRLSQSDDFPIHRLWLFDTDRRAICNDCAMARLLLPAS